MHRWNQSGNFVKRESMCKSGSFVVKAIFFKLVRLALIKTRGFANTFLFERGIFTVDDVKWKLAGFEFSKRVSRDFKCANFRRVAAKLVEIVSGFAKVSKVLYVQEKQCSTVVLPRVKYRYKSRWSPEVSRVVRHWKVLTESCPKSLKGLSSNKSTDRLWTFEVFFQRQTEATSRYGGQIENFQKREYLSPYADAKELKAGSVEFDKRAIAVIHEVLSFMNEKQLVIETFDDLPDLEDDDCLLVILRMIKLFE
ncbi:hypothetical protein L6452_20295 [Arctium lappa]|uniref:Uncharacterized protein n=1 Tax=Arctium lappa TaxID=4217 RepID=A0ACB9BBE0_ARCLA|nr:hypothetical protein L6452_20295 [Arctium lappa]